MEPLTSSPQSTSELSTSLVSPPPRSREELAALIRRLPPGQAKSRAVEAFKLKYANKPDLKSSLKYVNDPVSWIQDKLGEFVWSKQRDILNSVVNNRRTSVHSCHGSGKSFTASRLAAWWISCHPPGEAVVVTTAPTAPQVKAILWKEIGRAFSSGKLIGRLNQTEWWYPVSNGDGTYREELVAFGRKPADYNPTGFQGIHARYVLVIGDEAAGIPKQMLDAVDSLLSNDESRLLLIGNPDDPTSEFASTCKPGSGYSVIHIGYHHTPNFTGEEIPPSLRHNLIGPLWVEEKRKKWGENNPLYKAKVLGEFPEFIKDSLIPISWIKAAQDRDLPPIGPCELGVDVGGGADKSVIAVRRGGHVRIPSQWKDNNPDTMHTLSNVLEAIKEYKPDLAKVDYIGIGHGAVDRAREMANDQSLRYSNRKLQETASKVIGIEVGRPAPAPEDKQFVNLRAYGYWNLRTRFEEGSIDIDPQDEDLAAQLVALKYQTPSGRIQMESKKDMRDRGLNSPDDADAVMLSFLPAELETEVSFTWGKKK